MNANNDAHVAALRDFACDALDPELKAALDAAIRVLSADRGEAGYVDADELCVVQGHDDVPRLVAGGREIAAFIPGSWPQVGAAMYELGKACGHTPPSPAESAEDRFEHFCAAGIARSPEPLRELGEYLGRVLDEDQFPTADRLLLQLATAAAPSQVSDAVAVGFDDWWAANQAGDPLHTLTVQNAARAAWVAAQPQPGRVEGMEYEFEIFQDDSCQAGGTTFTLEAAVGEGSHYEMMYGQDGPVEVRYYEKRRIYPAAAPTAGGDA